MPTRSCRFTCRTAPRQVTHKNILRTISFYARGLSRMKLGRFRRKRQPQEKRPFRKVISEWRQNQTWLAHLEKPVETDRRHYYEGWLGRYQPPGTIPGECASELNQCLSLAFAPGLKKYNLGSDFYPLLGETHLGLPWGKVKALVVRLMARV